MSTFCQGDRDISSFVRNGYHLFSPFPPWIFYVTSAKITVISNLQKLFDWSEASFVVGLTACDCMVSPPVLCKNHQVWIIQSAIPNCVESPAQLKFKLHNWFSHGRFQLLSKRNPTLIKQGSNNTHSKLTKSYGARLKSYNEINNSMKDGMVVWLLYQHL